MTDGLLPDRASLGLLLRIGDFMMSTDSAEDVSLVLLRRSDDLSQVLLALLLVLLMSLLDRL